MQRRTLDIIVSTGALALAGLLVILGVVMLGNARFAETYTGEQLEQEQIRFKPADQLSEAELAYTNARTGCVVTYAGQPVTSGEQAACFANEYMLGHLQDPEGTNQGMTFAEWGAVQAPLRAQIAEAEATNDPALADIQAEFDATEVARNSAFRGAMLRNALLTSYGFSVLGEKAAQAARMAFIAAGILGLLAIAGYIHAWVTPKTAAFAAVEFDRELAKVRQS